MLKYSIIVPCYRSSRFIRRLLETVPQQNDIEIILVDDSFDSDEYRALKQAVKNFPVKICKNKNGKGVSGARNTGLDVASGEWVLFADSDDMYITNNLRSILDRHDCDGTSNTIFRTNSKFIDTGENSGRSNVLNYYFSKYATHHQRVAGVVMQNVVYTTIFKLDTVKRHKIRFENYRMGEDALFMAKIARYSKEQIINETVGYTIIDNKSSVTRNPDYQLMHDWVITSAKRNSEYAQFLSKKELQIVRQTRFVIVLKTFISLGLGAAIKINKHASKWRLPYIKKDDLLFMISKLKGVSG